MGVEEMSWTIWLEWFFRENWDFSIYSYTNSTLNFPILKASQNILFSLGLYWLLTDRIILAKVVTSYQNIIVELIMYIGTKT